MEQRSRETSVSPTERTIPNDPDRTLAAPRFDDKSVQGAQPAVPLTRLDRVRSTWPTTFVVVCVVAGLVGGVLGGLAIVFYQRNGSRAEPPAAARQQTTNVDAASGVEVSQEATAANEPAAQDVKATTQNAHAREGASEQAESGRDAGVGVAGAARTPSAAGDGEGAGGPSVKEADAGTKAELRAALDEWLAATNARDVGRQMQFYAPTVNAFYLSRNTTRDAVLAEKSRVFARADSVDVRASAPDVRLSPDGQTAVMRFRKRYQITGGEGARSGEVLQELRWRRTREGWRIVSERDLRVLQ